MTSAQIACRRAAFACTFGAATAVLFSVAVCQILMALALAALLLSGDRLRFPPVRIPLLLFVAGTVVSMAFSADPAAGRPQIRKFFVYLMLLLVVSVFRELKQIRWLVMAWAVVAGASASAGLVQLYHKWQGAQAAGAPFYEYYVGERISGFMSHWMTFGGQIMMAGLLLAAFVFFAPEARRRFALWLICGGLILLAILAGFTRSIWLATAIGGLCLVGSWRPKLLFVAPVVLALGVWLGPEPVRARITSVFVPHGETDSNQHRVICWRTGWEMIKAHPWLGLGPELVKERFDEYVPADISRPLPEGWYGHLHNVPIHYAAERGVPTALFFLWLLGKMLFDFIQGLRRQRCAEGRYILHGAVAVVLAILAAGIFELNLGDTEVLTMFLAIAGCGYVVLEQARGNGAAAGAGGTA